MKESSWRNIFDLLRGKIGILLASLSLLPLLGLSCTDVDTSTVDTTTLIRVRPSLTDPAIKTFDSPHYVYVNREIIVDHKTGLPQDRHELLLWLSGTGGDGSGASEFCKLAANEGYHVISLMYPNSIPAARCRYDADVAAFEKFRMAIIQGGEMEHISVDRPESIENRLVKLLILLQSYRPREDWSQFLTADNSIKWESIAVAGQSQGGGHAALLAIKQCVARAICTGAPKDYNSRHDAPAEWYNHDSATPKNRFFVFNHSQDPIGCTPEQLLRIFKVLKLDAFGMPVDPAQEKPPYRHTRILLTGYPQVTVAPKNPGIGAKTAHTSVIANNLAPRWMNVWRYMLTESVR